MWAAESVEIMMGSWGWDDDGVERLPRPEKVDRETGRVLVEGDRVLIDFIDGNPRRPVVRGGARRIGGNDFFARKHEDVDHFNRARMRFAPKDRETGEPTGHTIEFRISDESDATIDVRSAKGNLITRVTLDEVRLVVDNGGSAQELVRGVSFLTDLQLSLTEIAAGLKAFGIPTVNTDGTLLPNIITSLIPNPQQPGSTGKAPYLTDSMKAE